MIKQGETYIGDGVYASFDGYQIWLRVERAIDHTIALDAATYQSLRVFAARIWGGSTRLVDKDQPVPGRLDIDPEVG